MRRLKMGTAGVMLAIMLAVPRAADAGGMGDVIDVIIGLTGPQMVGAPFACELDLAATKQTACYFVGFRYPLPVPPSADITVRSLDDTFWRSRDFWLSLGGGVYGSTPKDSKMRQFEIARIWMLAFEPMVNYRLFKNERENFVVELGAGPSVLSLFGEGFDAFAKGGIKVTPSITRRNVSGGRLILSVGYTFRFFPNAFTSEDFGGTTPTHSGREVAHGFSLGLRF